MPTIKIPLSVQFFRIFSVLTMAQFLLPIVFENLFFPLDRKYFYFLGWVTALLFFHPRIFKMQRFFPIYFFAAWYFIFIYFGIFEVDYNWIRGEIESVFFAVIMLQYFIIRDVKWLKPLMVIIFGFIVVTIFTSVIGLQSYPMASREMAGALVGVRGDFALIKFYQSIGIAEYDFFYGLAFAVPALVAFVKLKKNINNLKVGFVLLITLIIYAILIAQFTTAFLFAVIGSAIAFWTDEKIRPALLKLTAVLLVVVFFPKDLVGDLIYSFSRILDEGIIQRRLTDLSTTLIYGLGEEGTHIDRRYARIPFLLENFFQSPLIGGGISLGHNWLLDRLSMFGLAGVLPWAILLWFLTKYNLKLFFERTKIYYLITIILWITMGLIKNMGQQQTMIFLFFIIPSLLIVKDQLILKSKKVDLICKTKPSSLPAGPAPSATPSSGAF